MRNEALENIILISYLKYYSDFSKPAEKNNTIILEKNLLTSLSRLTARALIWKICFSSILTWWREPSLGGGTQRPSRMFRKMLESTGKVPEISRTKVAYIMLAGAARSSWNSLMQREVRYTATYGTWRIVCTFQ